MPAEGFSHIEIIDFDNQKSIILIGESRCPLARMDQSYSLITFSNGSNAVIFDYIGIRKDFKNKETFDKFSNAFNSLLRKVDIYNNVKKYGTPIYDPIEDSIEELVLKINSL